MPLDWTIWQLVFITGAFSVCPVICVFFILIIYSRCKKPSPYYVKVTSVEEFLRELENLSLPLHCAYSDRFGLYKHHFVITYMGISAEENVPNENTIIITQEYTMAVFPTLLKFWPCCCCGWICKSYKFCNLNQLRFAPRRVWGGFFVGGQLQRLKITLGQLFEAHESISICRTQIADADYDKRLKMRPGEPFWHLRHNNCEHYANWVMEGKHRCLQLEDANLNCCELYSRLYFIHSLGRAVQYATFICVQLTLITGVRALMLVGVALGNSFMIAGKDPNAIIFALLTVSYECFFLLVEICMFSHLFGWCQICYGDFPLNRRRDLESGEKLRRQQVRRILLHSHEKSPELNGAREYLRFYVGLIASVFRMLLNASAVIGGSVVGHMVAGDLPPFLAEFIVSLSAIFCAQFFIFPAIVAFFDLLFVKLILFRSLPEETKPTREADEAEIEEEMESQPQKLTRHEANEKCSLLHPCALLLFLFGVLMILAGFCALYISFVELLDLQPQNSTNESLVWTFGDL